jgi:hypothetical protein
MTMKRAVLASCLVLSCLGVAAAEDSPTPEAVATEAIKAMNAHDYAGYTSYMHPDALKSFRTMMSAVVDSAAESKAESQILALFHEVKSVAALREMSDPQFFTSFLQGLTANPLTKEALGGAECEILGHIKEGNIAHVVGRIKVTMRGASVKKMTVISLQPHGKTWKMLLTGELEGLAAMLKAR